ncbi:MAG: hypothetical protein HC819_18810 [Cyclobacteriaceae bacterium]|nr:hypothetical protein [Cyclobacteriaceae bacterium]
MKYIIVYLISMFKFVGGPAFGAAYNLNLVITACMTILGMMTSVIVISFYGQKLRKLIRAKYGSRQKLFTRRNRRIIKIWRGYGEFGVSFFTPVFFSPVIGTLLVTTLGGKRKRIFTYMLISAIFWAFALASLSDLLLDLLFRL